MSRRQPDVATRRIQDRLRALGSTPGDQAAFAAEALAQTRDPELLAAILEVLKRHPLAAAHGELAKLYDGLAGAGPRKDPGGFLRAATVDALRPISVRSDAELFERASTTYEHSMQEAGSPALLRAAGLLALNHVDESLAAYHAVRLLGELEMTSAMNGEPAVTAARVLGAMGHGLVLYHLLVGRRSRIEGLMTTVHPEVLAEALRAQTDLPAALLPGLRPESEELAPAWIDLLVSHDDQQAAARLLVEFLDRTRDVDLYRDGVAAAIASRRLPIAEAVAGHAEDQTSQPRLAVLIEYLPLAEGQITAAPLVARLTERLQPAR
jgi:hypothetical protein